MTDKDVKVRQAAALAIADIGPKAAKAIPALIGLLKSGDAAYADIPVFPIGFSHPGNVALVALDEMDTDAALAVPVVTELLKECDNERRIGMFRWLAARGAQARAAIPNLHTYLASNDTADTHGRLPFRDRVEVRCMSAAAILAIDGNDRPACEVLCAALEDRDAARRRRAVRACAEVKLRAKILVPLLIAALDDPTADCCELAVKALGNMGPLAEPAIPHLAKLVTKGQPCAYRAAIALTGVGNASIPALVKLLRDAGSTGDQGGAPYHLGAQKKAATVVVPELMRALRGNNEAVRMHAAAGLGRLGQAAAPAREVLTRTSKHDENLDVRVLAAWALTQLDR